MGPLWYSPELLKYFGVDHDPLRPRDSFRTSSSLHVTVGDLWPMTPRGRETCQKDLQDKVDAWCKTRLTPMARPENPDILCLKKVWFLSFDKSSEFLEYS